MPGLGIDYDLLANMGERYQRGMEFGMNKALMPLKVGLMGQQMQRGEQELQIGQITLEEKQKLAQFSQEIPSIIQANPGVDPFQAVANEALRRGFSQQAIALMKENSGKLQSDIEAAKNILLTAGPQAFTNFVNQSPSLKQAYGNITVQDMGEQFEIKTDKEIPGLGKKSLLIDKRSQKITVIDEPKALTEAEILALPETDPRKVQYMGGKKELQKETPAPSDIRTFEMETGTSESMRGTPEYQSKMEEWRKKKGEAYTSNIFIGTNPVTGNVQTIPSRGTPTVKETPAPKEGIGPKVLSEDFKKDYTAVGQAYDLVKTLKDQWDSLNVGGRFDAVKLYGEAIGGANPEAKLYIDDREGFLGNLSRSLAAERGVLTQQDIERISKTLPKLGPNPLSVDNQKEAEKKWLLIEKIIDNAEKRMKERQTMSPGNIPGVKPEVKTESPHGKVIATGTEKSTGKKVKRYEDGTVEYELEKPEVIGR